MTKQQQTALWTGLGFIGLGVAFLMAQLCYSIAFASQISALLWWPLILLATYGVVIYGLLFSSLGRLKWPVLIYMVGILAMAWLAWERWGQTGQSGALLAAVGALLFVLSDTVLAIDRFRKTFKLARALNLSTYFAAQCLIASSVGI